MKRVTRKFHAVVVQDKDKEMQKNLCCTCKVVVVFFLLLMRRIVCFFCLRVCFAVLVACLRRLALHDFIFM